MAAGTQDTVLCGSVAGRDTHTELPDLVSPPHLCRIIDYDVLLDDVLPDDAPGAAARTH